MKISQLVETVGLFWGLSDLKHLSYTILNEIYLVSPLLLQANTGIVLQVTSQ